jgi:thiosulfate reductase cytochrome b subunit
MHWINFPLLAVMIWSGLRIYWANDVYRIGIADWTLFAFFPDGFNERLDLDRHLARGMAFHFTFAWLFTINGILYALYTWRTGEWRFLAPDRRSLKESGQVLLHDLHLRKEAPPTNGRYNAAQRLSYSIIILLGGVAVLSGFAIYKPAQLSFLTTILGGYETARAIHFSVTIAFLLFFFVHVLQVARAGWRNCWSMIVGYELEPKGPAK